MVSLTTRKAKNVNLLKKYCILLKKLVAIQRKLYQKNYDLICKAIEGSIAHHSINHDFSFRSNDSFFNFTYMRF